ncbi:MAG TPA: tetratricopeptide repeat protein [Actinomycetes bacterium]
MAGPIDQGPAGRGDPAAAPLRPRDPSRLGPFTLLGRLPPSELGGRYLGRRVAGEQVEILHLRDELLDDPGVAVRLRAKVDAARLVAGRGVVQVVDSDLDARPAWLATEHVQGLPFGEFVAKVGALPADRVHGFAVGVAEALAAIHAAGVVHGELKPKHVLLTRMGPKLTHLALARVLDEALAAQTTLVVETAGWFAPEELAGGEPTAATDVFAWGVLVVLAATGRQPFGGDARSGQRILEGAADLGGLDEPLRDLVASALRRDPAERPFARSLLARLLGEDTGDIEVGVDDTLEREWVSPGSDAAAGGTADRGQGRPVRRPPQFQPDPAGPTVLLPSPSSVSGDAAAAPPPGRVAVPAPRQDPGPAPRSTAPAAGEPGQAGPPPAASSAPPSTGSVAAEPEAPPLPPARAAPAQPATGTAAGAEEAPAADAAAAPARQVVRERMEAELAEVDRALEGDADNPDLLVRRGMLHRDLARFEDAYADVNRLAAIGADALQPNSPAGALAGALLGTVYLALGRPLEAVAELDRALAANPALAWALAHRGDAHRRAGRYDQALADLDQALLLDPDDAFALATRGTLSRDLGRYDEAVADLGRALAIDPEVPWVLAARGLAYQRAGRNDAALADLDHALRLQPDLGWALAARGAVQRELGDNARALADLDRAVALEPRSAWIRAERGVVHRLLARFDRALADFDRALELDPEQPWALAQRAITLRVMEDHDKALRDLNKAVELDPESAWIRVERGITHRLLGHLTRSMSDLDRALDLAPAFPMALVHRAVTHRSAGRRDRALADLNRALKLDPELAAAYAQRGVTYRLLGRYEQALADLERALELDPANAWATAQREETRRALLRRG